ncbi:hypothetical protein [Mycoplasma miroungirhinis]|uniref:Uncharacterized protein n=1 Tax=Mycoplasma miroungirhinis TaxID=754516 RepID=A0A6M4JDK0_9MOLU|nr:hypothetical protein [Mycoplasma miroungirhinis]QJR44139.1 hypothetical protein HLA92_01670 [Mycoplasma miroungirhinis]
MDKSFYQNHLDDIISSIKEYENKNNFDKLFVYFETLAKEYQNNLQLVFLITKICLNNNYYERARKYSEPLINLVSKDHKSYNELMCAVYDRNYEFYNAKYFLLRLLNNYPNDKFYLTQMSLYNSFINYFNIRHSFITYIYEISKMLLNEVKIFEKELKDKKHNNQEKILNLTINTIPDLEISLINDNNIIIPKITFNFEIGELILLTYLAKSFLRNHHIDMIISLNPYIIPTIINKQVTTNILKNFFIYINEIDYHKGHKITIYHNLINEDELAYLKTLILYLKLSGNYQTINPIFEKNVVQKDNLLTIEKFLSWSTKNFKQTQMIHHWKNIADELLMTKYTQKHIFSNFLKTYKETNQYFYFDLLYRNGLAVLNLDFETSDVKKTQDNFMIWVDQYSKEIYQILNFEINSNHLYAEVLMFDARSESLTLLNNSFCTTNTEINTLKIHLYQNPHNKEIIYSKHSEFQDLSVLFDYPLPEICNNQTINTFKEIAQEKTKYLQINNKKLSKYYFQYRMMKINNWINLNYEENEN